VKKYPASVGAERLLQKMSWEIYQFHAVFFNRILLIAAISLSRGK
jgi:hypothetical protein